MVRRLALALLLIGLCAGCASGPAEPAQGEPTATATPAPLTLAGSAEASKVSMLSNQGSVSVGDSWESARGAFPDPRGSYEIHDLPSEFPVQFNAHGWETPTGEGFGTITLDGKVVLAMYQLERTKHETVQEFLDRQEAKMGQPRTTVIGRTVTYWFWTDSLAHQSLMLCELTTSDGVNATMALGDDNVLAKINISPILAEHAAAKIDGREPLVTPGRTNQPSQSLR